MEKTLMELVDDCKKFTSSKVLDGDDKLAKIKELEELGLVKAVKKKKDEINSKAKLARISEFCYIVIGKDKIKKYLKTKVERYEQEHPKKKEKSQAIGVTIGVDFAGCADFLTISSPVSFAPVHMNGGIFAVSTSFTSAESIRESETFSEQTHDYMNSDPKSIGQFKWTEVDVREYEGLPPKSVIDIFKEHKRRNLFDYFTIASVNAVHDPLLLGRIDGSSERFFIGQWGDDVQLDDLL